MQNSRSSLLPSGPRLFMAIAILVLAALIGGLALFVRSASEGGSGIALVGGPFEMVNQDGSTVTEKNYAGRPMLIFFGYTFCPDVCPTELQIMSTALEQLGSKAAGVQPVFVSIDPARDTPAIIKNYLESFGPRWTGLTGSAAQVAAMARAWHVFYEKRENKQHPEDYYMDHSPFIFLMGADGKFIKHFSYTTDVKAFAEALGQALG